jgi:hypothetical protein
MERQGRIEFPGDGLSSAFAQRYGATGVMNRGDHQEPIFRGDKDRRLFLKTWGEACEQTGGRFMQNGVGPIEEEKGTAIPELAVAPTAATAGG